MSVALGLDRVPMERISAEAREVQFGRTVLLIIAGVLYGIGWVTAKAVTLLWHMMRWTATAVTVGWVDAWRAKATDRGPA